MHRPNRSPSYVCKPQHTFSGSGSSLTFIADFKLSSVQHNRERRLSGNWLAQTPNADGTFRPLFHLKQEGPRVLRMIRVTQFYY